MDSGWGALIEILFFSQTLSIAVISLLNIINFWNGKGKKVAVYIVIVLKTERDNLQ